MSTQWTEAQKAAIEDRGGALLLSAAAGSGKTAVLVERVVGLISDNQKPVDITELLIVTFSNAAAAEMRHRIGRRLSKMLEEYPENHYLQRQYHLIGSASIQTIHSFCMNLIRDHFQELSIPPDFTIIDERELLLLQQNIVAECIEVFYEKEDSGVFEELVELISSTRNDNRLAETVFKVYHFARSHPFYEAWLEEMLSLYEVNQPVGESIWGRALTEHTTEILTYAKEQLECSKETLVGDEKLEKAYLPSWESDLAQICNILDYLKEKQWDNAVLALRTFHFQRLGAIRGEDPVKDQVKGVRDRVKELITPMSHRILNATEEEFRDDMKDLRPKVELLFRLVAAFGKRLKEEKLRLKKLDFSDLEHYALQLLVEKKEKKYIPTVYAKEIGELYEHVLVDEYQDTNEVQDLIFTSLSNDGERLFMVGDVKQSIYSFRLAMPEIFMAKKQRFYEYNFENPQHPATIHLDQNFRSRPQVSETVNDIFTQIMSPAMGEIDYNQTETLKVGRTYPPYDKANPEFLLMNAEDYAGELNEVQLEAKLVAEKIKTMLDQGYQVAEGDIMRPATPRDFCILMRSPNKRAEAYIRALEIVGLSGVSNRAGSYLASREISVIISLLMALDNPLLDVELAAVLLSPVGGFSDDDLVCLRLLAPKQPLFHGLVQQAEAGKENSRHFLELFRYLGFYSASHPVSELLMEIYRLTHWLELVLAMPFGTGRKNNLLLLVEHAAYYHGVGYKGLSRFIYFLRRLLEAKGDLEGASAMGEGANVIEVLSIHRSKGLEYPIVILADANHRFNKRDLYEPTLLHSRYGFATKRRDHETLVQYPTIPLGAIQLEMQKTLVSEEMRVFYVALTRAKEKLIITATIGKGFKNVIRRQYTELLGKKLPSFRVGEANSYAEWMIMALLHHTSGSVLEEAGDLVVETKIESQISWNIEVISPEEGEQLKETETPSFNAEIDSELLQDLTQRLTFQYSYKKDTKVPTKLAVSDVVAKSEGDRFFFTRRPRFLTKQKLTPAQRGNALHKFMQFASYENAKMDLHREVQRMEKDGYLSSMEIESLHQEKISAFFHSSLAERMFASPKIYRELRFITQFGKEKLASILEEVGDDSKVVVQGVADCVFIENNEAIILDYKTDHVSSLEQLENYYREQVLLYKEILEETLQMPVKHGILYSFQLSDWKDVLAI